jgi:hypothetical protein
MFGTLRGKLKGWVTAGAGTIAAILVAGLLGAFGALPKPEIQHFAPDAAIETGQWLIKPLRLHVGEERVYGMPIKPDQKAVILEVELTNRTAESTKDYFTAIQPAAPFADTTESPLIVLTRDQTMSPELQPGLPERMAYIWTLPKDRALPASLSFTVNTQIYKARDNLYGTPGWYNQHPAGTVSLPLQAKGGSA